MYSLKLLPRNLGVLVINFEETLNTLNAHTKSVLLVDFWR